MVWARDRNYWINANMTKTTALVSQKKSGQTQKAHLSNSYSNLRQHFNTIHNDTIIHLLKYPLCVAPSVIKF